MESIKRQVDRNFSRVEEMYYHLLDIRDHDETFQIGTGLDVIEKSIKFWRRRRFKKLKTDNLRSRLSKRIRKVAKLYAGVEDYYREESFLEDYIMNIIKLAMEEVENEKDNN